MIDNLLGSGDDGDDAGDAGAGDDEMDGLFDDPGEDPLGGGEDDLMGGDGDSTDGGNADDDLMGDGDPTGGGDLMDGGGGGGSPGGGGGSSAEFSNRMDELEDELDTLSSTVETVKGENEHISDSLEDVRDNVRKLLEVYEMVTRGVNPFVDETELGDAFDGGAGGSMSVFDDGAGGSEAESSVGESVADADAEEFFEEDLEELDEEDDGASTDPAAGGDDGDGGGVEAGDADGDPRTETDDVDGEDGGGKSFEDLKAEYDVDGTDGDGEADGDEAADDEGRTDADGTDAGRSGTDETDPADGATGQGGTTAAGGVGPSGTAGKPYLETLPAGYVSELAVMEWLEFLVDEAGLDGAARTVAYYEAIGWISSGAAESLQTHLAGFGEPVDPDPEPRSPLTVDHHETSLRYLGRLADPSMAVLAHDDRTDGRTPETAGKPFRVDPRQSSVAERYPSTPARRSAVVESDGGVTGSDDGTTAPSGRSGPLYRGGSSRGRDGRLDSYGFVWGEDRR